MPHKHYAIIILILVGGLLSGCVIEPIWYYHHGHHYRY